jgi:hypothetical protein
MKHKHAELMAQYAQDALETDRPWERWEYCDEFDSSWEPLTTNPKWFTDFQYRRKPKVIIINGFEVPEPVREPLKHGQEYYIPIIADLFGESKPYAQFIWTGTRIENSLLSRGLIHLPKEAAAIHARAILSFTETNQ